MLFLSSFVTFCDPYNKLLCTNQGFGSVKLQKNILLLYHWFQNLPNSRTLLSETLLITLILCHLKYLKVYPYPKKLVPILPFKKICYVNLNN